MSNPRGTILRVMRAVVTALRPLESMLADANGANTLLIELGVHAPLVPPSLLQLRALVQQLSTALTEVEALLAGQDETSPQVLEGIIKLGTAAAGLFHWLNDLPPKLQADFAAYPDLLAEVDIEELVKRISSRMLIEYLRAARPEAYNALVLLGIIEIQDVEAGSEYAPAHTHYQIHADRLRAWLTDPVAVLADIYGWGTAAFSHRILLVRLQYLMLSLGYPSLFKSLGGDSELDGESPPSSDLVLHLPVFSELAEDSAGELDAIVRPTIPPAAEDTGLLFIASAKGKVATTLELAAGLSLTLSGDLEASGGAGIEVRPPFQVRTVAGSAAGGQASVEFAAEVSLRSEDASRFMLFEQPGLVTLNIAGVSMKIGVDHRTGIEAVLRIEAQVHDGKLAIGVGEADGFLQRILPKDGINASFDLTVGWSNREGLYFRGGAGLEVTLPVNRTLFDALTIDSIYLAIKAGTNENEPPLRTIVAVTAHLKLGPVAAVVERMGLRADFDFPASGGNLGPVDLALGFKPPDGAGISISTSIVSGGGYLSFNADAQQYAGAVYLELAGKFSLTALGLITTRMPDGKPGFSMLIIIAVEFSPGIQLGYGFMLTGIGGLLGINRTVNTEVLRSGIRTGMLNSVLFPKKVIENAPQIFSNLSAAFPPLEGHFIVGPAVKIAWGGAVQIIAIELGIALEFAPAPQRLLIMGRLIASLPNDENPIVHLQMDSLGIIDFVEGTISLDAVLYDSRIRELTISGGMALRVGWSKNAAFLLSVGGYHPDFRPPPNFPVVDRLAIGLAQGDMFRLRLESYFALTANTVQTGARLEIYAEAGGFSLAGFLGFDVLVHFSPFQFQAAIQAGVVLKRGNQVLMSIMLDVTLTGPQPWLIDGRASFSILGFSHSIPIHHQIGDAKPEPPLEAVDVTARLLEALRDEHNWSSSLPAGDHPLVALAETTEGLRAVPEKAKGKIWAHPAGNLTLRQRVVPLNQPIAKFGEAPVISTKALVVALDFGAGAPGLKVEIEQDHFAPAQFKEMSDAEKLSSPSFVLWDAGLRLALESVLISAHKDSPIGYEEKIITWDGNIVDAPAPAVLSPTDLDTLLPFGAVAQAPIRNTGRAIFATPVLAQKSARRPA